MGVLAGLRVVELGQVLAGPFAGAIFADLGAEVIKLERPEGGDDARRMGPAFRHDDAMTFHIFNRGEVRHHRPAFAREEGRLRPSSPAPTSSSTTCAPACPPTSASTAPRSPRGIRA